MIGRMWVPVSRARIPSGLSRVPTFWAQAVRWSVAVSVVCSGVSDLSAQQVTARDYARAEQLLPWYASPKVSGDQVDPVWMEGGSRFWYRNKTGTGHEFVFVDPGRNVQRPLFDHHRLASAMSTANDTSYVGQKLPFDGFEFQEGSETVIEFKAGDRRFRCDIQAYSCTVGDTLPTRVPYVESPDGRWEAFVHEHDLYVREASGGDTIRLTDDGEEYNAYGLRAPRPNELRSGAPRRPSLSWAPDSRKLAVSRQDQRGVEHMHYISYTPQRPVHYSQPYALPGDSVVPLPTVHVIHLPEDLEGAASATDRERAHRAQNLRVRIEPRPNSLSFSGSAVDSTWADDSGSFVVSWLTRGSKSAYLGKVDGATGEVSVLARDTSKTFVETNQRDPVSWFVTAGGDDVFWWSERDGWAHIWRFDGLGTLKNQVTSGPWAVGAIRYVDETNRQVYFTAYGREPDRIPYYGPLYRVGFDGGDPRLLTPEEGKHEVEFSPNGRFFVDTYSTIESPPVTVLRAAPDGRIVRVLEEADVSNLEAVGWRPSRVFKVKARDGVTDIWGVIDFPPGFDPEGSYPILDHIYPGPQVGSVGDWTFKAGGRDAALAQLGFVVVQIDHLGTPQRSKAFHDQYYGNFIDNGLADHVTAIQQLAARYPAIDLDRVGIFGGSGGGFASTDAILRYPDFFKVAVSRSGNHDNASYNIYWAEKYQGLMERDTLKGTNNFQAMANKHYAENLKGRLLLIHGDLDDNVHPAMTVQLVDALIRANKDFDLIWGPDYPHGMLTPYFVRKRWDYFVEHLLGVEPPQYEIRRPEG